MLKTVALLAYMLGNVHGSDHPPLQLISPAFPNGGTIPVEYTCRGKNLSLPLRWGGGPAETKSYAVVMTDVDAPKSPWYHWVIYNIPGKANGLNTNNTHAYRDEEQAENSWGQIGYRGPCPPTGTHQYVIRLYALDAEFNLPTQTSADVFQDAIHGHVLATTRIVGRVAAHQEGAEASANMLSK